MWNRHQAITQDSGYQRLALALCASILLHIFLLGGFNFSMPYLKKELHVIEARIQMPKAVPKVTEISELEPIQEELVEPPAPVQSPDINQVTEIVAADLAISEAVAPVQSPSPIPLSLDIAQNEAEAEAVEEEPQPIDAGLVINENAYQYVVTEFDVRTAVDGPVEGTATITFNLLENSQYQLTSLIKAEGLAALIIPDLLQTSDGLLTKSGLQPLNYLYQFGDKADKTYQARFDWQSKTLHLTSAKGEKTLPLLEGSQDLLSFMYQFMYVAPLQNMQINITNGKKLASYDYTFEGEENINSSLGEVKSIHITRAGFEADEKTELWLAVDYQYIPVKIRKTEKDGKLYELVATGIETTRPVMVNPQAIEKK
ncbi:MAG: DUF3108 domain-containing protein [Methylophilaceae bacterium]